MNNKDFQKDLKDFINTIPNLDFHARLDFFEDDSDDLIIIALPGGRVSQEYMDGVKEVVLPYEIAIKSKANQKAIDAIWAITDAVSALEMDWVDGKSYNFVKFNPNRPAMNGRDPHGYFVYNLQLQAVIEIGGK